MRYNATLFRTFIQSIIIDIIQKLKKCVIQRKRLLSAKGRAHLETNGLKIIDSTIKNCTRPDKLSLDYLLNPLFSELQYESVAGFDLGRFEDGQFIPFPLQTPKTVNGIQSTKKYWHKLMMTQLYHLSHSISTSNNNNISQSVLLCSEEYDMNGKPSTENANQNEFKVFIHTHDSTFARSSNTYYLNETNVIYHQCIDIHTDITCINVHNSSNQKGRQSVDQLILLLKQAHHTIKSKYIIMGGDSNVYYSHPIWNKKFNASCINDMNDVIYFYEQLKQMDYNLYINKTFVYKQRPQNFFSNAQSATKGGQPDIEETMFIAVPKKLKWEYNSMMQIHVNSSSAPDLLRLLYSQNADNMLSAFSGVTHNRKSVNSSNFNMKYFQKNLLSDHVPIYGVVSTTHKSYALIFTNNASILGKRGLVQNRDLFGSNITKQDLQRVSDRIATYAHRQAYVRLKRAPQGHSRTRKNIYSKLKLLTKTKLKDLF